MKTPLLALFTLIASSVSSALAAPEAGRYTGLVTITKTVNDLSHTYTLRAEASVAPNGQVTILTAIPEAPSAAMNVDNSVTIARPYEGPTGLITIGVITISLPTDVNPGFTTFVRDPNYDDAFFGHNYVIDDTLPADLVALGQRFTISYTSPKPTPPAVSLKHTRVEFKFTKKR